MRTHCRCSAVARVLHAFIECLLYTRLVLWCYSVRPCEGSCVPADWGGDRGSWSRLPGTYSRALNPAPH